MRTLIAAGTAIAALVTPAVDAQQMIAHGPPPAAYPPAGAPYGHDAAAPGGRWGSKVDGHWWGGVNAPGGWRGYRRPSRGWTLPHYWVSPRFAIDDWGSYGLPQPPTGYGWSRYYDDAVLIDDHGAVYDSVDGIDWDGYAGGDAGYASGYAGDDTVYADRADRHVDRHRRVPVAPAYPPAPPVHAPPAPPPPPPPPGWSSPDGQVTVVTTGGFYGGSTTVVTVRTPPVITTTTTDIYEDRVTYHAPVYHRARKVVRRHVWRPRCGCR